MTINVTLFDLSQVDFPNMIILLCSIFLIYFDWRYLSYPIIIWYIFFLLLMLTTPFNAHVLLCLLIALITEIFPLKIGSGDWLYLSLISYAINFSQLIQCLLFASSLAIIYMISSTPKRKEIPFIPFLFIGYILTLYFFSAS